jgi:oxygen-independent coproporphyrinogen-3 oxidase
MQPIGLYLHIPFCARKCPYCDFYSLPCGDSLADAYADALCRAAGASAERWPGVAVATVYFGGGTPSVFGAGRLLRVLRCLRGCFSVADDAEITVELNPASAMREDLRLLREGGVNRVSFGVQSLCDSELSVLGRLHSSKEAAAAILEAAEAGFPHISADLMLAVPGQTPDSLRATVSGLAALPVDHISAYLLKAEPGPPFAAESIRALCPDEDEAADYYLSCVGQLAGHGFAQYEISNFARRSPGREGLALSRHNLNYWRCGEYLGLGPAAHSFLDGERFHFPADLNAFLGEGDPLRLLAADGPGGDAEEAAMLALRLTEGLDLAAYGRRFPQADTGQLLRRAGQIPPELLTLQNGVLRLTPRGFLLSNTILARLL